ncbi:hypothetical protein [Streptomyces collinus]|nr:hypothetical protein [Streptomyces collinus]
MTVRLIPQGHLRVLPLRDYSRSQGFSYGAALVRLTYFHALMESEAQKK